MKELTKKELKKIEGGRMSICEAYGYFCGWMARNNARNCESGPAWATRTGR